MISATADLLRSTFEVAVRIAQTSIDRVAVQKMQLSREATGMGFTFGTAGDTLTSAEHIQLFAGQGRVDHLHRASCRMRINDPATSVTSAIAS